MHLWRASAPPPSRPRRCHLFLTFCRQKAQCLVLWETGKIEVSLNLAFLLLLNIWMISSIFLSFYADDFSYHFTTKIPFIFLAAWIWKMNKKKIKEYINNCLKLTIPMPSSAFHLMTFLNIFTCFFDTFWDNGKIHTFTLFEYLKLTCLTLIPFCLTPIKMSKKK